MKMLLPLVVVAAILAGCSLRYTRKTEVCQQGPPPVCTTVKDSAGVELEKD